MFRLRVGRAAPRNAQLLTETVWQLFSCPSFRATLRFGVVSRLWFRGLPFGQAPPERHANRDKSDAGLDLSRLNHMWISFDAAAPLRCRGPATPAPGGLLQKG